MIDKNLSMARVLRRQKTRRPLCVWRALRESVDGWLLANIIHLKTFGGQPKLITASGCDEWLASSSRGVYVAVHTLDLTVHQVILRRTVLWGT